MRPSGSPQELERRRQRAIALLDDGLPPGDVATRVGVDRRSVRRWKAAYHRDGAAGIRATPASGRPPKLRPGQQRQLVTLLIKGAQAAGYTTDLWTCPRIAAVIWQRFRVRYHVDHIGRLLHALGQSAQHPRRRAVERDEAAIQRWVTETWPRVKKTPRAAGRRSSSSTKPAS